MSREWKFIAQRHKRCLEELRLLQTNVEMFLEKEELLFASLHTKWQEDRSVSWTECDDYIERLTLIFDMSSQLNERLGRDCIKVMPEFGRREVIVNGGNNVGAAAIERPPPLPQRAEKKQQRYVTRNLQDYTCGTIIKASVTHVENPATLRFYIWDTESVDLSYAVGQWNESCDQYKELPPPNEVFGIREDQLVRAVLESETSALLIDFGYPVEIKADSIMYRLPEDVKNAPAEAMPAKLIGVLNRPDIIGEKLGERLNQLAYETATFEIHAAEQDGVLQLMLVETPSSPVHTATNPFQLSTAVKQMTLSEDRNDHSDELVPLARLERTPKTVAENLPDGWSADDLEILNEESLCTTNALKAVMGHAPKDEQRICRFFNPKTNSCFKGYNCSKDHEPLQPDGWTKDLVPATHVHHKRALMKRYANGSIIKITPTYVNKLESIYAQIIDKDNPFHPLMWNSDDIRTHMTQLPLVHDMVLARYEDGLWYRAKVVEVNDYNNMVMVFFVDYGNCQLVRLHDLCHCATDIAQMPFQATQLLLANREEIKDSTSHLAAIADLRCCILNQTFDVEVVDHVRDDILIRFTDK